MRFLQQLSFSISIIFVCAGLAGAVDLDSAKRAYEQKNYAMAFKEASALAEKGNADAQVLLGKMYLRGRGVLTDPDTALKWFKEAAAQGNADGEFLLGSMYLLPRSNIAEGLKWVRLAADQGNQDAQLLLGKTYLDGLPELPRDPVQADMWLRLAADHNLPFYQSELHGAEQQMNAADIAKGKALAEAWKPKHGTPPEDVSKLDEKPKS
jgi:TPR repeat protein